MINFIIDNLTAGAPLFKQYDGELQPQPAYVSMGADGDVEADWSGEVGNAVPMTVWHNRTLRWRVPAQAEGTALAEFLRENAPLFERVHAGHSIEWDGNNMVGKLTNDAQAAFTRISDLLETFEPLAEVWSADAFLFSGGNTLNDVWAPDLTLDAAVEKLELDAAINGIVIHNSIRDALIKEAGKLVDRGEEDDLSETQFRAWCEENDERIYYPGQWGTPQSERGQIVQSSYGIDIDYEVIVERRFDASDRTTKYYAYRYHPEDTGDEWSPAFETPMLGESLGRCCVRG